jgi:hypothetical protein
VPDLPDLDAAARAYVDGEARWSEPKRLPCVAGVTPSMPMDFLPDAMRGWISDTSVRICVPVEYVGLPSVVSVGCLLGRCISIRPKRRDDWSVVSNLWGASIGGPGTLKSPAITAAMKPLRRLSRRAEGEYATAKIAAAVQAEIRKARLDAIRKELAAAMKTGGDGDGLRVELERLLAEQAAPIKKRYVTNDSTTEKLGELLIENPRGLLLLRDELTGWLHAMEKPGRESDRAFFLEAWEGIGAYEVDRIGRGSLCVPSLTLSVYGGIQPDRLASFFSGAMADGGDADGLLQRHQLVAWPDDPGEWRNVDRFPDTKASDRAFRIFERLDVMDAIGDFGAKAENDEIPFVRFADDAQELFDEWRTKHMHQVRSKDLREAPGFASHLAKYPSLLPKLALIFHVVAVADGSRQAGRVALDSARLAAAWCDFLEAHARKVYAPELEAGLAAAHLLAEKIRAGAITDHTSVRDVYRRQWSGLRTSATVYHGLDVLAKHNWLRLDSEQTGGADRNLIRFSPRLGGGS